MQRLDGARELLDGPLDERLLAGNLRDLHRINRWLGGVDLSWRALRHVLAELPTGAPVRILDVGTGAADIPLALLRRAAAGERALEVEATDVRPEIVDYARQQANGAPGLHVRLTGTDAMDHPAGSFDVVHASLVLHHLEPAAADRLLAEMARVARHAVIVNDLDRGRGWWLGAWLVSRLITANRYTRHDAPLSVRRAYRPAEVAAMAAGAGLRETARFRTFPAYRYALVLR